MYKSQFDCPPSPGIPCTSVTDLESMIVEMHRGPNLIAGSQTGSWNHLVPVLQEGQARKVWMAGEEGCQPGHYIYLTPDEDE